jgi:hypothetical protein
MENFYTASKPRKNPTENYTMVNLLPHGVYSMISKYIAGKRPCKIIFHLVRQTTHMSAP